ncbi:hypothetical protein [Halomonas sp. 3A7M]|uniref:hypothetical protein n=1 Tax=Halomonas sp. 3A7M TaxID=2742616 RepID=UPI0018693764|nr:hypothetical protein [Halomonas sp. 3A7M]
MAKLLEHEAVKVEAAQAALQAKLPGIDSPSYVAFVVWLPASDEFLHKHDKNNDATVYQWVKGIPAAAKWFPRLKRAKAIAAEKEGAVVAVLLETEKQYMAMELENS